MVASKDYLDEAIKRGRDIGRPNSGEELARYVATELTAFPPATVEDYRRYVEHQ